MNRRKNTAINRFAMTSLVYDFAAILVIFSLLDECESEKRRLPAKRRRHKLLFSPYQQRHPAIKLVLFDS